MVCECQIFMIPDYWPTAKRALSSRDPVMKSIIKRYPGIPLRNRGDAFVTLARSIVGQQISVKAADSVWHKVLAAVPQLTPDTLSCIDKGNLAQCGLSLRKVDYLKDLAKHFSEKILHVEQWPQMSDDEIINDLVQVHGIGRWTAEMFLIFNLLRPNVLPVDDVGLQRAVSIHYRKGKAISASQIRKISQLWHPWCSVATWYLWRSLDPVPVEY